MDGKMVELSRSDFRGGGPPRSFRSAFAFRAGPIVRHRPCQDYFLKCSHWFAISCVTQEQYSGVHVLPSPHLADDTAGYGCGRADGGRDDVEDGIVMAWWYNGA
jgi:hypothetical protein